MAIDRNRIWYITLRRLNVSAGFIEPSRKLPLVRAWTHRASNGDLHGLLRVHKLVIRYWWRVKHD